MINYFYLYWCNLGLAETLFDTIKLFAFVFLINYILQFSMASIQATMQHLFIKSIFADLSINEMQLFYFTK